MIVNPGTGPVDGGTVEQAVANARQLLDDARLEGQVRVIGFDKGLGPTRIGGGRWRLALDIAEHSRPRARSERIQISMPGIPLDEVRPDPDGKVDQVTLPRIYVDGSSWWWWIGVSMLFDE